MTRQGYRLLTGAIMAMTVATVMRPAAATVDTAVYARVGNGYERKRLKDGSFKPEHYALSNGGRIDGTTSDKTVDRVTYPEVAAIASRFLAQQNYHYAQSKEQAKLLIVLQWGSTLAYNRENYASQVNIVASAMASVNAKEEGAGDRLTSAMELLKMYDRMRDQINTSNARVLGYMDDLAESNGIQRAAGGGDRYADLIADVEETRYYIMISAYDFPAVAQSGKKKLLWQVRVSVRSPGNSFDDSMAAMFKSASKFFGQDSGRLIRAEESKGTVELGEVKILGEAKETKPNGSK